MRFLDLAKERYSVRKFSDKPVEQEKLDLIVEAGRIAPTAHNNQPQRILVLQGKEAMEKLLILQAVLFNTEAVWGKSPLLFSRL